MAKELTGSCPSCGAPIYAQLYDPITGNEYDVPKVIYTCNCHNKVKIEEEHDPYTKTWPPPDNPWPWQWPPGTWVNWC